MRVGWKLGLGGILLLAVFLWAYWHTFVDLIGVWQSDPDYGHGWLVVPLAFAFLWLRRGDFPAAGLHMSWAGLLLIAASLVMRVGAVFFSLKPLDGWSILLWAAGAVWLLGGISLLRFCWPSVAFLVFMVPLPYRVAHTFSLPLQRMATQVSCWLFQLLGRPALAEGNIILLDGQQLEVARACSGLRIFFGILAVAFAYVIVTRRKWWENLLILASAVPIALLANSLRIMIIGFLYSYGYSDAGKRLGHDLSGWLMIPLAALMFAVVVWYLGRLMRDKRTVDISEVVARNRI